MTRSPVGERSRPLRFLIVTLVVAVYTGLGFLLHPNLKGYMLLGIPLLLIFQLGIQRQPLRALWVSSGPPLRLDAWFLILWALVSLVPAYQVLMEAAPGDLASVLYSAVPIAGGFGLAYALRAMRAQNVWQLGLCILTVGAIGTLPSLLSMPRPDVLHLHIRGQPPQ